MCIHPVMHKLTRSVDFRVKATLEHGEQMFIVGSCKALGLWQHYKAVPLTLLESAIERYKNNLITSLSRVTGFMQFRQKFKF